MCIFYLLARPGGLELAQPRDRHAMLGRRPKETGVCNAMMFEPLPRYVQSKKHRNPMGFIRNIGVLASKSK